MKRLHFEDLEDLEATYNYQCQAFQTNMITFTMVAQYQDSIEKLHVFYMAHELASEPLFI
jgi:hypothetical protein